MESLACPEFRIYLGYTLSMMTKKKSNSIFSSFLLGSLIMSSCSLYEHDNSTEQLKAGSHKIVDRERPDSYYVNSHSCKVTHDSSVPKKVVNLNLTHKHRNIDFEKRSPSSVKSLYKMAKTAACPDLTTGEIDDLKTLVDRLDGRDLYDPTNYEDSAQGLQNYIDDVGVIDKFSAAELISPNHPGHAQTCGFKTLLPPQCRWAAGAAQGLVASKLREVINDGDPYGAKKITLRNWYRPRCYNSKVGGASASDHIQARGFDLDFETPDDRAKAQKYLCQMYKKKKFNLQVGIGCQTLHVGIGSPKRLSAYGPDGSRFWTYGSLQRCSLKRVSGDDCWLVNRNGHKRIHTDAKSYSGGL
ncbi:MAG: hypothetical protein CME60_06550 [Halobacteriovoraceae bacterium]|nr:hypothetical protein [Halobacteriovoraceae bacterium]|tara:strand:+ start:145 stop:1215 length:1071 start_codon:yes stop_codon:yes gene_type:complete